MRRVATPIFTVLGVTLLAISLLTGYATALLVSDSGFANHTVAALEDPGVQSALSTVITNKLMSQLPLQYRLAQPLVERATSAVLASSAFHSAFRAIVFHAHHAALSERNNKVVLNLSRQGAVISTYLITLDPRLAPRLNPAVKSLSKIGGTDGLLPLIRALKRVRQIAIIAPILALFSLVLALATSMNRRHTMRTIGISAAALGGLIWLVVSLAGWLTPMFLSGALHDAMPGLWAAFTGDLKRDSLILAVLGLILVAAAARSLRLPSSTPTADGVKAWFDRSWADTRSRAAMAGVAIVVGIILILSPVNLFRAVIFAIGAGVIYFGTSSVLQLSSHQEVDLAGQSPSEGKGSVAPPLDATRWSVAVGVGIVFLVLSLRAGLSS